MKVLIFEWHLSGGCSVTSNHWSVDQAEDSIVAQGTRMVLALAEDFLIAGVDVRLAVAAPHWETMVSQTATLGRSATTPLEAAAGCRPSSNAAIRPLTKPPQPGELELVPVNATTDHQALGDAISKLAHDVDHVLTLAPEFDDQLLTTTRWNFLPGQLLNPSASMVSLTGDKLRLGSWLLRSGFHSLPSQWELDQFERLLKQQPDFDPWPIVLKPVQGAGSASIWYFETLANWKSFLNDSTIFDRIRQRRTTNDRLADDPGFMVQPFVCGHPVSVSVIQDRGSKVKTLLPPTGQQFDRTPIGDYIGSTFPLQPEIAERASRLATQVLEHLPPTQGYFGIDMVIADSGQQDDVVIEVNPRLTLSYIKLRQVVGINLAALMLGRLHHQTR